MKQEQGAVVVNLTPSAWADGSATAPSATIESTGLKYGIQTLRVTDNAAADDTITFTANTLANNAYVDLTSVATSGQLLTISGTLAIGDQIRYANVLSGGGGYSVTVNADATFSFDGATPDGSYTFEVRAWDTSDQTWGTAANQTVQVGAVPEETVSLYTRMRGLTQVGSNGLWFSFRDETRTLASMNGAYFSNKYASTTLTTGDALYLKGSDGSKWVILTVSGMTVTFTEANAFS
jgi:hypothetical protein